VLVVVDSGEVAITDAARDVYRAGHDTLRSNGIREGKKKSSCDTKAKEYSMNSRFHAFSPYWYCWDVLRVYVAYQHFKCRENFG
jgi:hypothetical protein